MMLGEVSTLQRGFDLPIQNRLEGEIPIYAANGPVGFHNEMRVAGPGVITGRSGSIGNVHYVEGGYWPLNTSLYVKDFHGNDPKYIYWLLRNLRLDRFHHGTGVPTLNRNVVHRELVPIPPLPEQRRIAAILDKADALRVKRREAITKLDQLLQSVFLEMFGDPVANPKGWPLISFADVGQWKSGATPSKSEPAYWDGSFPWVSPKDMKVSLIADAQDHVSDLAFQSTNLKRIEPGHLLIVVRGMILAHSFPTAVNAVPVAINQDMKAIKPIKDLDIIYLKAAVDSLKGRILSVVSTAGHGTCRLDTRDASEVKVPVPPLGTQLAYRAIANKNSQLRVKALAQLEKLDSMFLATQQKAFDGAL